MERNRLEELERDLAALRARLEATADDPDTEGAHMEGDSVLLETLRLLSGWFAPPVAVEVRALADRFDELSRNWWYA